MSKTKIVCTLGPASNSESMIRKLIDAGADVFRLNFSHSTQEEHLKVINTIKILRDSMRVPVAIMADLQGPKIRVGKLDKEFLLKPSQKITITTRPVVGNENVLSTTYSQLHLDIRKGSKILIDDGLIELKVEKVQGREIECRTIVGGIVKEHKGMNLPKTRIRLPSLTEKDVSDLKFLCKLGGIDFISVSFVRTPEDILFTKKMLGRCGASNVKVIAKIEREEAVNNLDEIIAVCDGVMVARGDLGVEEPTQEVPIIQKSIIRKCSFSEKPVITATQMLESMTHNIRPTRAETSDVANAVFDGTDAVMLSAETASGQYPIEAVRVMSKIVKRVEREIDYNELLKNRKVMNKNDVADGVSHVCAQIAGDVNAKLIVAFTISGNTARLIARYRPSADIVAVTPNDKVYNQLSLVWGIRPVKMNLVKNTDQMIFYVNDMVKKEFGVKPGERIIVSAGVPLGVSGETNFIKVHRVV